MKHPLTYLQVKTAKDDETTPAAAQQMFDTLLPSPTHAIKQAILGKPPVYSFEIYLINQMLYLYAISSKKNSPFLESIMQAAYPKSSLVKTTDPIDIVLKSKFIQPAELTFTKNYALPIKTYRDLGDLDSLTPLFGVLTKQPKSARALIQFCISATDFNWQKRIKETPKNEDAEKTDSNQHSLAIEKAKLKGAKVWIRLLAGSDDTAMEYSQADSLLSQIAGSLGSLGRGDGNQLKLRKIHLRKSRFMKDLKNRSFPFIKKRTQIINSAELATLWHPTGFKTAQLKNVAHGKKLPGEPPASLPTASGTPSQDRQTINFFAKTEFRNADEVFGIRQEDRRRHMYVIGKTGSGKSTLIANMAIDDIRNNRGVGIIDPHGDLAETILDYIPKRRINDVVYLEPFDTDHPFTLNVLEVKHTQHRDLVSSGIVAIFGKLYADSWGPRLEYILRNTIITLLELESATLADALRLLSDKRWRDDQLKKVKDAVILDFWHNEFDRYTDRLRAEAISPIQNKIGQFVTSRMIRNIIGSPHSSVDLQSIMDEGKILILNLSQGKLGEDNASLLGAMIITQIQLAAMNRAYQKESDRKDFALYVDEFQNFATTTFIKILSEARKYRLSLTLTNQYVEQLTEEVQRAIFGNVGTLVSFVMGSRDAELFSKEFGSLYTPADLVNLGKYEILLKLCIDNMTSPPFPAHTLPLPAVVNANRAKIIAVSKERYCK